MSPFWVHYGGDYITDVNFCQGGLTNPNKRASMKKAAGKGVSEGLSGVLVKNDTPGSVENGYKKAPFPVGSWGRFGALVGKPLISAGNQLDFRWNGGGFCFLPLRDF